ncbi:MAG: hypothetical protein M5U01_08040 [Ardenticatenaceae bacterium]|nr:hypothetical protein [Ardenticatenaceae bacterium]
MAFYRLHGVTLATDVPLRALLPPGRPPADVTFILAEVAPWPAAVWSAARCVGGAPPHTALWQSGAALCLREPGVADAYIGTDTIVYHPSTPASQAVIELRLLGPLLSLWLDRRGVANLHAAAVVLAGRAHMFLATNGGGKSSLAAGLVAAGASLLSDDLVALSPTAPVQIAPGSPQLRFWPDTGDHFFGDHRSFPLVHPNYTKRWVTFGRDWGRWSASPAPLAAIYLPERAGPGEQSETRLAQLPPRAAVLALIRHTFSARFLPTDLQADRLAFFTQLVGEIPILRLHYPGGYDRLPIVAQALLRSAEGATRPHEGEPARETAG